MAEFLKRVSWTSNAIFSTPRSRQFRDVTLRLCIQDEGFAIYDLNSLNGTRVNELRLIPGQPVFLRENDEIMLAENQEFNFQAVGFDSERTELWMLIPNETSAVAKPTRGLLYQSEDGSFVLDGRVFRTPISLRWSNACLNIFTLIPDASALSMAHSKRLGSQKRGCAGQHRRQVGQQSP